MNIFVERFKGSDNDKWVRLAIVKDISNLLKFLPPMLQIHKYWENPLFQEGRPPCVLKNYYFYSNKVKRKNVRTVI